MKQISYIIGAHILQFMKQAKHHPQKSWVDTDVQKDLKLQENKRQCIATNTQLVIIINFADSKCVFEEVTAPGPQPPPSAQP